MWCIATLHLRVSHSFQDADEIPIRFEPLILRSPKRHPAFTRQVTASPFPRIFSGCWSARETSPFAERQRVGHFARLDAVVP